MQASGFAQNCFRRIAVLLIFTISSAAFAQRDAAKIKEKPAAVVSEQPPSTTPSDSENEDPLFKAMKYRVVGPLSNIPAFAQAFGCKAGSPMVRDESVRCEVW